MSSKKTKPAANKQVPSQKTNRTGRTFDTNAFFEKYYRLPLLLFLVILLAFCLSVFKNIRYPLFWADESITAVGGQRVLKYGYPKVHDGKNVFYDLPHKDTKLGIDAKTDAYVGGTGWLHYYVAAVAVKIASVSNNMYTQTGIIRSVF